MSAPEIDSVAGALVAGSRPRARAAHWHGTPQGGQLFVVDRSRIFDVEASVLRRLDVAATQSEEAVTRVLEELGVVAPAAIDDEPVRSPPLHALSLAVAQKCNMACSYCYAAQGDFGGDPQTMSLETAQRSIDLLIDGAEPASRVNVAFLGGEPLANRAVVRAATRHAAERAERRGVAAGFSITTNGTLLTEEDGAFFEEFGFAVTISLDGLREAHDRRRVFKSGAGTFDRIMARATPLLARQQRMQVSVRATVTPDNLQLRSALDWFLEAGFHSVGFSPVLNSQSGADELAARDLDAMLDAMLECGAEFERRVGLGQRYAFANIVNAMRELHRGTHRPYPCGAGAGYLGVSADGDLAACHRFVGDKAGKMGNLAAGIDRDAQNAWLATRHVHQQTPCGDCWARYLCGGGCHHEVIARGRGACDYIRGWLHYCLQAYARVSQSAPDWLGQTGGVSR
jgi:uncharacterized protein